MVPAAHSEAHPATAVIVVDGAAPPAAGVGDTTIELRIVDTDTDTDVDTDTDSAANTALLVAGPSDPWDLVRRVQNGDTEAFGEIFDLYSDTVFRYVYYRVAGKAIAEDLTSETFLRALRRIGSISFRGRDLGAWLITIARNLVADHYKSGRQRLEISTGDILDADRPDGGQGPEAEVMESITSTELLSAVRELGAEQQECIVLRFLHGMSVAETAAAMGKNEGAIKALQYRAVRSLHRLLPPEFVP